MKLIPLTQGQVAIVDDDDYETLSKFCWQAKRKPGCTWYASRAARINGKRVHRYMHRELLGLTDRSQTVDHINGDGLDNRRANLRIATPAQNKFNTGMLSTNTSGYKGITRHTGTRRWTAKIRAYNQTFNLGSYDTAEEAARAYDKAAREKHGEYARTNFK